jgi:hypothetical protein
MIPNKNSWCPPLAASRCRKEPQTTDNESLLQILAAADMDDEDDMAIRAALFVTLRELGADNVEVAGPRARGLRTRDRLRYRQRLASGRSRSSIGTRRRPCTFLG